MDVNCEICGIFVTRHESLKNHMKQMHACKNWTFLCRECDFQADTNYELSLHSEKAHVGNSQLEAARSKGFKEHPETKPGYPKKEFKCGTCNFGAPCLSKLNLHIKGVHTKIKDLKCSQCNFGSATDFHLQRHIASVHDKFKDHKCPHCGYVAAQASHIVKHVKTAHFLTTLNSSGKRHVTSVHKKANYNKCPACDYKTKSGHLKEHMKEVHLKIRDFGVHSMFIKLAGKLILNDTEHQHMRRQRNTNATPVFMLHMN
jgi:uncharacterized Zn-finger protein